MLQYHADRSFYHISKFVEEKTKNESLWLSVAMTDKLRKMFKYGN